MNRMTLPLLAMAVGCAHGSAGDEALKPPLDPVEMTDTAADPEFRTDAPPLLLRGATVMNAAGDVHAPGFVLVRGGRIDAVGPGAGPQADGVEVLDLPGAWITPGIIDVHSHMGVYPLPSTIAHNDGNESVEPVTAGVWAEHAFWPQDPSLGRALASGVTTIQVLPGSANLIGGRSFTARLRPATSARAMRFPGAPQGLKMACGENPKRSYGESGGPKTRMGNVAGYRRAFQSAREYARAWEVYERDLAFWQEHAGDADAKAEDPPGPPERDLGLETLVAVLRGDILVHAHCYRADEMHIMLDLAREFGFHIRSFHHALEAYKLADRLAAEDVGTSTWADWWGFKMEAFDGVPHNVPIVSASGARAIIHSDSPAEVRWLNHEAAKARTAGRELGIETDDDTALRWITANPAWALGIDDQVGTLEPGKVADIVVWDGHPFSVYSRASLVFIDGARVFDRSRVTEPRSDFELGQPGQAPVSGGES